MMLCAPLHAKALSRARCVHRLRPPPLNTLDAVLADDRPAGVAWTEARCQRVGRQGGRRSEAICLGGMVCRFKLRVGVGVQHVPENHLVGELVVAAFVCVGITAPDTFSQTAADSEASLDKMALFFR
jgi:hypothetical protein